MENSCEMENTKHQENRGTWGDKIWWIWMNQAVLRYSKCLKVIWVIFVEISVRPGAAMSATKAPTARCLRELKIDKSEVDALGTRLWGIWWYLIYEIKGNPQERLQANVGEPMQPFFSHNPIDITQLTSLLKLCVAHCSCAYGKDRQPTFPTIWFWHWHLVILHAGCNPNKICNLHHSVHQFSIEFLRILSCSAFAMLMGQAQWQHQIQWRIDQSLHQTSSNHSKVDCFLVFFFQSSNYGVSNIFFKRPFFSAPDFSKKKVCRMAKKPASTMKLWSFTCSSSAMDGKTRRIDWPIGGPVVKLRNSEAKVRQKTVTFLGTGA